VLKYLKGDRNRIGDTIPVDYVVNTIIVASAFNFKQYNLPIYHVGSSDRNPLTWGEIQDIVIKYWNSTVS
jgi:fatty acyl-CoA reductase